MKGLIKMLFGTIRIGLYATGPGKTLHSALLVFMQLKLAIKCRFLVQLTQMFKPSVVSCSEISLL